MALEAITNTGATYQEAPKPVQKVETTATTKNDGVAIHNIPVVETAPVTQSKGSDKEGESGSEQEKRATEQQLRNAINQANNKLKQNHKTGCEFSYHEATKRVSIKIYDEETKEVIKEIPPEKSLEMLEKMWEMAGILVDGKL